MNINPRKCCEKFTKYWVENKLPLIGLIGGSIIIALGYIIPHISHLPESTTLTDIYAIIQAYLTAVGFLVIFVTLLITISQFQKSLAKPKIRVVFSENGETAVSVDIYKDIPPGIEDIHELKLSAINEGDAITKFFQIDFFSPPIYRLRIDPSSQLIHHILNAPLPPKFYLSVNNSIASVYNLGQIVCFVNKPAQIPSLLIGFYSDKFSQYSNEFVIKYRVFGDWSVKTQEGSLKVVINKQEGTNVPGTG
jgi:hypothetical protein